MHNPGGPLGQRPPPGRLFKQVEVNLNLNITIVVIRIMTLTNTYLRPVTPDRFLTNIKDRSLHVIHTVLGMDALDQTVRYRRKVSGTDGTLMCIGMRYPACWSYTLQVTMG